MILGSDLRLSINFEQHFKNLDDSPITQTRVKERTSFQIGWTRIDLTVVDTNGNWEYEVELEIADTNHIISFANDPLNMKKKMRKFLLNQVAIAGMIQQVNHRLRSQNGNSNRGKILLDET